MPGTRADHDANVCSIVLYMHLIETNISSSKLQRKRMSELSRPRSTVARDEMFKIEIQKEKERNTKTLAYFGTIKTADTL